MNTIAAGTFKLTTAEPEMNLVYSTGDNQKRIYRITLDGSMSNSKFIVVRWTCNSQTFTENLYLGASMDITSTTANISVKITQAGNITAYGRFELVEIYR